MSLRRATKLVKQRSPGPFWHQGPVSWKIIFPWTGAGWGVYFQNDSSTSHLLYILFQLLLDQLHLRSSGIRSRRLGTPVVTLMEPSLSSGSLLSHSGPELPR